MITNKPHFAFGIPNVLTVCRIVLTPLFVILLMKKNFGMALFIFGVAGISDGLDGFIARCYNQRTVLGAYLDPVADKLLLVSAFICLPILQVVPRWLTVVVIFREVLIAAGILILIVANRHYQIIPSFLSKCNTVVQIVTVSESLLILLQPKFNNFHYFLCWITAALTFLSGLQYVCIWFGLLQGFNRNFGVDG